MLGSISPFGERARRQRWGVTFGAFLLGSVAAGLGLGATLGAAGGAILELVGGRGAPALAVLAAFVVFGLAPDLGAFGLRLPTTHRQVNEDWLHRYRGWVYGLGFGFQLGLGVVTIVSTSAVYATFGAAFLAGSAPGGALVGGAFGFVRGMSLLGVAHVRRPDQVHVIDGRLRRWEPRADRFGLAAQVALVGLAAAAAL
jgi:hypothetical protein